MAKKTVATLQEGKNDGRSYTKVIKMVKSPKTGAYVFDEQMVPIESVKDFFKNYFYHLIYILRLSRQREGFFIPYNHRHHRSCRHSARTNENDLSP